MFVFPEYIYSQIRIKKKVRFKVKKQLKTISMDFFTHDKENDLTAVEFLENDNLV